MGGTGDEGRKTVVIVMDLGIDIEWKRGEKLLVTMPLQ